MSAGLFGVLVLAAAAPTARAELIEFTYGGELEAVLGNVPDPWSGVAPGTAFEVRYVFDSESPDLDDSSAFGIYDAILSYTVTLDGASLTTNEGFIQVELIGIPRYMARFNQLPLGSGASGKVGLSGFGVLDDDSLPTDIDIDQWNDPLFEMVGADFEFAGLINTFSSRILPSPGTLAIFFCAAFPLSRRRRKF